MSISALRFSSPLLRLPLASAHHLLRKDRRRLPLSTLLRCFSTSPSRIRQDDTFSTKPHASKLLTKPKKLAKEIRGATCLEVFDIRIQRFDGKRNSRIYGTVVVDGGDIPLYHRPMTNPESVHLGFSPLLLTGPEEPFAMYRDEIEIDIKDADTDREIIRGFVDYDEYSSLCDKFIQEEVLGTHGSALVSYAMFKCAVSATIEVTLVNGGADVHGVVAASNTFMSRGQSVLFFHGGDKEEQEKVSVGPGGLVPLSRCVVSLPEDSDLNVRVELWDREDEIAIATGTFRLRGRTSTKIIPGKIEVKVTWM